MVKIRIDVEANYKATFFNGKTIRMRINPNEKIRTPKFAEIEDVAINSKCFANCPYCYTSATKRGSNFNNIVEKAIEVWSSVEQNHRPFQIAIGGAGESTIHSDWTEFVKTVEQLGITPNYTTNGMHLSEDILKATEDYCGGVAVSWHPHIENVFHKSINKLAQIDTKLNTHVIVGSQESLHHLKLLYDTYADVIDYFVVLPYQAVGRGVPIIVDKIWKETFEWINSVESKKFAFGALFYEWLLENEISLDIDVYEPEIFSGYRMFDDTYNLLRKSSYDLSPKNE